MVKSTSYSITQAHCIQVCEDLVTERMGHGQFDSSHDELHVFRVRSLALDIAKSDQCRATPDLFVVEVTALLHDIFDHKYSSSSIESNDTYFANFLANLGIDSMLCSEISRNVARIGYTKHISELNSLPTEAVQNPIEVQIVREADYLDAMGAVGIMRTSAFSGARGIRLLPDVTQKPKAAQDLSQEEKSCVLHFHDKLLKLKDLFCTLHGAAMAYDRHEFMLSFLSQISSETGLARIE